MIDQIHDQYKMVPSAPFSLTLVLRTVKRDQKNVKSHRVYSLLLNASDITSLINKV